MAALNFLRYLLIGDTQERNEVGVVNLHCLPSNPQLMVADLYLLEVHSSPPPPQTGVWGIRSHLHTSFVAPVRQLLTSTKMVCRQEMEAAREEKGQRAKDGPECV